jgi:predicted ester cyclase
MSPETCSFALATDNGPPTPMMTLGTGLLCRAKRSTFTENTEAGNSNLSFAIDGMMSARLFNARRIRVFRLSVEKRHWVFGACTMAEKDAQANALRNKESYLKAKAAFNAKDMAGCMSYYALDHQIRSRPVGPGREHIEQFLTSMHENWSDLEIVVDHAIAEDDWVVGRCTSTATHSKPVMGVAPTGRQIQTAFWDMHRFNAEGKIVETWNVTDSLVIMQQLGLIPASS